MTHKGNFQLAALIHTIVIVFVFGVRPDALAAPIPKPRQELRTTNKDMDWGEFVEYLCSDFNSTLLSKSQIIRAREAFLAISNNITAEEAAVFESIRREVAVEDYAMERKLESQLNSNAKALIELAIRRNPAFQEAFSEDNSYVFNFGEGLWAIFPIGNDFMHVFLEKSLHHPFSWGQPVTGHVRLPNQMTIEDFVTELGSIDIDVSVAGDLPWSRLELKGYDNKQCHKNLTRLVQERVVALKLNDLQLRNLKSYLLSKSEDEKTNNVIYLDGVDSKSELVKLRNKVEVKKKRSDLLSRLAEGEFEEREKASAELANLNEKEFKKVLLEGLHDDNPEVLYRLGPMMKKARPSYLTYDMMLRLYSKILDSKSVEQLHELREALKKLVPLSAPRNESDVDAFKEVLKRSGFTEIKIEQGHFVRANVEFDKRKYMIRFARDIEIEPVVLKLEKSSEGFSIDLTELNNGFHFRVGKRVSDELGPLAGIPTMILRREGDGTYSFYRLYVRGPKRPESRILLSSFITDFVLGKSLAEEYTQELGRLRKLRD